MGCAVVGRHSSSQSASNGAQQTFPVGSFACLNRELHIGRIWMEWFTGVYIQSLALIFRFFISNLFIYLFKGRMQSVLELKLFARTQGWNQTHIKIYKTFSFKESCRIGYYVVFRSFLIKDKAWMICLQQTSADAVVKRSYHVEMQIESSVSPFLDSRVVSFCDRCTLITQSCQKVQRPFWTRHLTNLHNDEFLQLF